MLSIRVGIVHQYRRRWWCEPNADGIIKLTLIHVHIECIICTVLLDCGWSEWNDMLLILRRLTTAETPRTMPQNPKRAKPDWWCQFISYSQVICRSQLSEPVRLLRETYKSVVDSLKKGFGKPDRFRNICAIRDFIKFDYSHSSDVVVGNVSDNMPPVQEF